MDLNRLRDRINNIDGQLLKLLADRRQVAEEIIDVKRHGDIPLRDSQREEHLLGHLIAVGRELGLDAHFVTRVFHEIIDDSIRSQQRFLQSDLNRDDSPPERVAFQGIEGAYSHLAAQKFFSPGVDGIRFLGYSTFPEVVESVEEGIANYALLPVENTTSGGINEVYDLLFRTKLNIVGEEIFRVQHCLLGSEGAHLGGVRKVLSHPQALAQCTRFLSQLRNCRQEYYADTAMAVQKVKADGDTAQAAIASEEAGKLYGLKVLERNVADNAENFTRFVVVASRAIRVDLRIPSKTSLILATPHQPGALNRCLDVLTNHGINMTKLYSRPKPGAPFAYLFYIDFEGNQEDERVQGAIQGLRAVTSHLKILGSYPIEQRGRTPPTVHSLLAERANDDAGRKPRRVASPSQNDAAASKSHGKRRLVSREVKSADTIVSIRDVEVGGAEFVVIAGPGSVESEEQIRKCARQVKECGGNLLRAGCFKPRTSPTGFEGMGFAGLELLGRVGREYDLAIVTEVVSPQDVEAVSRVADVLLVGARNMQNYSLLGEVGKVGRPVILERGMMASLADFLAAAEYVLEQGNHHVILCERGIRTFETVTRNSLDLGAIPTLRKETHLPVMVDPSQAAGHRSLVIPLALAAHAVGPHGLMIDIHPDPENALSEGPQSLTFDEFADLLRQVYQGTHPPT